MKKLLLLSLCVFFCTGYAFSLDLQVDDLTGYWGGIITTAIQDKFKDAVREKLGKYDDSKDLGRGFQNAGSYAADSGYMRTATDYKLFAVSVSSNVGATLDGGNFNDFIDDYKDDGDIYMGAGLQAISASLGCNLGHLLKWDRGLYLTLKAGKTNLEAKDLDFDSYVLGFMANYQLVKGKDLAKHLMKWRGVNVGTGLSYYNSTIKWTTDDVDVDFTDPGFAGTLYFNSDLDTKAEISRFIVPVEITTGIKLAVVELFGGIGADFMFGGDSDISVDTVNGKIYYEDALGNRNPTEAKASVKMKSSGDDDFVKCKATVGIGLSLGVFHLEIPYTQYLDDDAFSGGLSIVGGLAF